MSKPKNKPKQKPTSKKEKKEKKERYNPFPLFFKLVVSIVLSFCLIASGVGYAYYKKNGDLPMSTTEIVSIQGSETGFFDALVKKNIKINVALFGVDEGGTRTDTMMVVSYDSQTQAIRLLSVPRDTRVSLSTAGKEELNSANKFYPSVLKINEVHAYAGAELGPTCSVYQLEELLGIKIDHYVKVNTASFRALVDAIGGVDVYIPQSIYKDAREPDGSGILINLKAGQQVLNGDQAEQYVRYRGYANADLGRIDAQQDFIDALLTKLLSTETLINNMSNLIDIAYEYIDTNLAISDALKYINYIDQIDLNRISMETLPGVGQTINGISYFIHDVTATENIVQDIFYATPDSFPTLTNNTTDTTDTTTGTSDLSTLNNDTSVELIDSKSSTILVSNGSIVNGLGSDTTNKLKADGFTTLSPTTYTGIKKEETIIYVKEEGAGYDLVEYFNNAVVQVDPDTVGTNKDIYIILGTSEQ